MVKSLYEGFSILFGVGRTRLPKGSGLLERPWAGLLLVCVVLSSELYNIFSPYLAGADGPHTLANPGIRSWSNLVFLFSPSYLKVFWEGSYHPLPTLLYFVEYAVFGNDPLGYHIVQTLIFSAIVLLIWRMGRLYMGSWAWVAAILYALSPLNSNIGDIRLNTTDELVTLFCLLAMATNRLFAKNNYNLKIAFLTAGLFSMALLSKEMAIVVPILLLLDDYMRGLPESPSRRRWLLGYCILAAVALSYAVFLFGIIYQRSLSSFMSTLGYSSSSSFVLVLNQLNSRLNVLWGIDSVGSPFWVVPTLVLLVVVFMGHEIRIAASLVIWVLVSLLPYSGILPLRSLSEFLSVFQCPQRYFLLPGVGLALLIGLAMSKSLGERRWIMGAVTFAIILTTFSSLPKLAFVLVLITWLAACTILGDARWIRVSAAMVIAVILAANAYLSAPPFPRLQPDDLKCVPQEVLSGKDIDDCPLSLPIFLSEPVLRSRYPRLYMEYEAAVRSDKTGTLALLREFFSDALNDSCRSPSIAHLFLFSSSNRAMWDIVKQDTNKAFRKACAAGRAGLANTIADFNRATKDEPMNADAYKQSAFAYWRIGDRKEAFRNYTRHLSLSHVFFTNNCFCATDDPKVEEFLVTAIKNSERIKREGTNPGRIHETLDKLDAAIEANPADMETLFLRGDVKAELDDPMGAVSDYTAAKNLAAEEADWRESLLRQDPSQSKFVHELRNFEGSVLSHRAKTVLKLGKKESAIDDLREALRISSTDWPPRAGIEDWLRGIENSK